MQSLGLAVQLMISKHLEKKGECPECQSPLFGWKMKNPDGSERCQPTCMNCGFTDMRRKEDLQTARIYNDSLKSRTLKYFQDGSVVTDKSLFNCNFENYKVVDQETKIAKETANNYVNAVLLNKPSHLVMSGKSGAGKSHLSMAACHEVIKRSNYDKKVLFIGYRELLEQIKFSFSDEELRKVIQGSLMADIKTADLVVIDDLGSELGGSSISNSTVFNNDTLNSIIEARQSMATIINTNLTGKELTKAYGERIISRIFKNSEGYAVRFEKTTDKRLRAV